jgi:hypothetical protein
VVTSFQLFNRSGGSLPCSFFLSSKPASGSQLLTVAQYGCSIAGVAISASSGQVLSGGGEHNNCLKVSKMSVTYVFRSEVTYSAWTLCLPVVTDEYGHLYSVTNVMHFLFNLLRIKILYMFRALLVYPQEALHTRHLVYCGRVTSGVFTWTEVVALQSWCSLFTAPPEDKQVMFETCRGP